MENKLPTSPDWSTAPDWAMWFAIDGDGQGWFYESRPSLEEGACFWFSPWDTSDGAEPCGNYEWNNWKNSLQKRPQQ